MGLEKHPPMMSQAEGRNPERRGEADQKVESSAQSPEEMDLQGRACANQEPQTVHIAAAAADTSAKNGHSHPLWSPQALL